MAPIKAARPVVAKPLIEGRVTRSSRLLATNTNKLNILKEGRAKRKADGSPPKETNVKRSAFGDITNAISKNITAQTKPKFTNVKKVTVQTKTLLTTKTVTTKTAVKTKAQENVPPAVSVRAKLSVVAKASVVAKPQAVPVKVAQVEQKPKPVLRNKETNRIKTRLSTEFEKTDESSMYSSALEDLDSAKSVRLGLSKVKLSSPGKETEAIKALRKNLVEYSVPKGIDDFDKENWNDIFQVSHYAMDIFNYLKSRESIYVIKNYMDRQIHLTTWMRSLLVNWMVEIQENFELNHETLYLGVKLVDLYLSKVSVCKETLQLVGAASMLVACKYDERFPPFIDDFLYICDGAYTRKALKRMEINLLKACNFDLGMPLSYRFLRRYARCSKVTMPVLTLARYVLEYSLMDYATVTLSDSKLGAASLLIARKMSNLEGWNDTLDYYTGYKLEEILPVAYILNDGLHRKPHEQLNTVRNKYSHKVFFEVAKTPLVLNQNLSK